MDPGDGTRIVQGDTTASGGFRLERPGEKGDHYEVVLHAPGFEIENDAQRLVLFPDGDSTPARFRLTPEAGLPPGTVRTLQATLWQADGAFVGRFAKDICVGSCPARATPATSLARRPPS